MNPADVDLSDLDVFEQNQAWPLFDVLREQEPLHWNPEETPNHGFWALTRHAGEQVGDGALGLLEGVVALGPRLGGRADVLAQGAGTVLAGAVVGDADTLTVRSGAVQHGGHAVDRNRRGRS